MGKKEGGTVRDKTIANVVWKFMERISAQLVSFVVSIIIARILSPGDYGVVSIVTIFFTFSNILISGGFNTALIQKKDTKSIDYSTVLDITLIFSVITYVILFLCAPAIAGIYKQPVLVPIIRIMGFILPINGVKSVVCAYVSSTLQFRKFFFSTLIGTVISAMVGIFMAFYGFGAWALVAQQMTNAFVDTLVLLISTDFRIGFQFSLERAKTLFGYGWKILVSSMLNTIYAQIRPLVIGIRFSAADLSFYSKGESFPQLIASTITETLSAVLFPVLSEFQDEKEQLLQYTRRFISVASFLVFPMMLGLFATADNVILVLLTDKWAHVSFYVRIFALAGMFDMIHIGNCETIKAMGRSDLFLAMEVVKKSAYFIIIGTCIVFARKPEQLALASILCTAVAIIVNTIPNRKLIQYRYMDQLTDILPNLITASMMAVVVIAMGNRIPNVFVELILQIIVGAIVYILLNLVIKNPSMFYLLDYLKKDIKR